MRVGAAAAVLLVSLHAGQSHAQEPLVEEPDPTRLDVERLPPEAIVITRDLYAEGFFLESYLGVRGFIGGVGDFAGVGPLLHIGFGYELARWLKIGVAGEGSIHRTTAPAPPSRTGFEVLTFLAEARLQANLSARAALWLGAEFGIGFATGDALRSYGLRQADQIGIVYGGQTGFDWHLRNRHHSFGVVAGARVHDKLARPDAGVAVGVHGALYLRYVF